MKVYASIGHFKGESNVTSVVMAQNTKKDFATDLRGNEFVAYVIITEKMLEKLFSCESVFDQVKKMTSNYRVWDNESGEEIFYKKAFHDCGVDVFKLQKRASTKTFRVIFEFNGMKLKDMWDTQNEESVINRTLSAFPDLQRKNVKIISVKEVA